MRMIDVLNMMANGEIKKDTKLIVSDDYREFEYKYLKEYRTFLDEYLDELNERFDIDEDFLNLEVELIPPKPKKYQLKLYKDDDLSYVTRSSYDNDFNYDLGDENEIMEFKTKFTQEEIDNDKLLKFIEQHGIKEEVEDDALKS